MRLLLSLTFSLLWLFVGHEVWAAACCGGGNSTPSLIAGDHKAQITGTYSYTEVAVANVDTQGIWHKWDDRQHVEIYRLDAAHLLTDRWQAGLGVAVVQRSLNDQTYAGLGDASGTLAYEYLPDWDYNLLRPKGIAYFQLTLPTGQSRAESEHGGLDSRGNGFWAVGLGTLLTKAMGRYDVFASVEMHHAFEKSFANSQMSAKLKPGNQRILGTGGGFSFKSWHIGAAVLWTDQDPIELVGPLTSQGAPERYATTTLSLSYLNNDEWSGSLNYLDQTLIGEPINTSLGRSIAVVGQRRWGR